MDAGRILQLSTIGRLARVSALTNANATKSYTTGLTTLRVAASATNKFSLPATLLPATGAKRLATASATRSGVLRDMLRTSPPATASVSLSSALKEPSGIKKSAPVINPYVTSLNFV
jgi:hypothetical protein